MADFNSIKQQVKNLMGVRFESYQTLVSKFDKDYKKGNPKKYFSHAITFSQEYRDKDGKTTAIATSCISANKIVYSIIDETNGRSYETDWQDMNNASDKFTRIRIWNNNNEGYTIEDSNHNGFVDENDTVTCSVENKKGEKATISVLNLLNGKI